MQVPSALARDGGSRGDLLAVVEATMAGWPKHCRMTGGLYCSSRHGARNRAARDRLSFLFSFDPSFDAEGKPIARLEAGPIAEDAAERRDRASVHAFRGKYGDYLLGKVAKERSPSQNSSQVPPAPASPPAAGPSATLLVAD